MNKKTCKVKTNENPKVPIKKNLENTKKTTITLIIMSNILIIICIKYVFFIYKLYFSKRLYKAALVNPRSFAALDMFPLCFSSAF